MKKSPDAAAQPAPAGSPAGSLTTLWERPGYLIRRLHQIHVAIFLEECAAYGVTPVQYAVMTALLNNPGADQVSIARDAGIDRTNVADVLARLEQRGLVRRRQSRDDRRMLVAVLTARGTRMGREMEHASLRAQARLMEPLNPAKRETLMALMAELVEANNSFSRAPARQSAAAGTPRPAARIRARGSARSK
ncbi:MAG: MarR family winged helix-turn-helix transcriptional regulator [Rhodospirillaceae bacterium]